MRDSNDDDQNESPKKLRFKTRNDTEISPKHKKKRKKPKQVANAPELPPIVNFARRRTKVLRDQYDKNKHGDEYHAILQKKGKVRHELGEFVHDSDYRSGGSAQ